MVSPVSAATRPAIHLPANAVVDLHMHSPYSDGRWTPETLPPAARALSLRVVALTASTMSGDRDICLAAGMDDYLIKPFDKEELFTVVERR